MINGRSFGECVTFYCETLVLSSVGFGSSPVPGENLFQKSVVCKGSGYLQWERRKGKILQGFYHFTQRLLLQRAFARGGYFKIAFKENLDSVWGSSFFI